MVLLQKHVGINKSILNKYYSNWLKFPSKKLKKHKLNGAWIIHENKQSLFTFPNILKCKLSVYKTGQIYIA